MSVAWPVQDSECPVKHIDTIAVAIRSGWTALDLATLRCAGQPELSPDPGMEPIALAAESVFRELHRDDHPWSLLQKRGWQTRRKRF